MAKKKNVDHGIQLDMFSIADLPIESPAAQAKIEEQIASWEAKRVVEPVFSKTERRGFEEFALMLAWVFSAPSRQSPESSAGYLTGLHQEDVVLERFVKVFSIFKEEREMIEAAKSEADMEAAYKAMINRWHDLRDRITDREVCIIFASASQVAPLSQDSFAEYMRAFAATYGVEKYVELFPKFEPLNYTACRCFRETYGEVDKSFPVLDKEWFDSFNAKAAMLSMLKAPVQNEQESDVPEYCRIQI